MISEATFLERHVTEMTGPNPQGHGKYLCETGLDSTKPVVDEIPSLKSGPDDGPVIGRTDDCFVDDFLYLCFDSSPSAEGWQERQEMSSAKRTPTYEVVVVEPGPSHGTEV